MYHELTPFGDFREDCRSAQVASYIFNMAVEGKDRKPVKDFLLPWSLTKEEDAPAQKPVQEVPLWQKQMNAMHQWAALYAAGGMKPSAAIETH